MSRVQRFGVNISRGWVAVLLLVGAIAAAAYWMGPLRPTPPVLELLVVDGDQAAAEVAVRGERDERTGAVRFALPLAVHNVGTHAGRPQSVTFSVPGRYRLSTARGPLDSEVTPGVPLRRYVLPLVSPTVQPGEPPQRLRGLETIWLEPDMPEWYCIDNNGVPEFIPSPQLDAAALSEVRIFYSLGFRQPGERSTGVLTVRVDPGQLDITTVSMPPAFPTTLDDADTEPPDLGPLHYAGERRAYCGDPEQPMELFTVTWETTAGGQFYVIYVHDRPRKHLYDLDGNGTVDLELWDADGDGRFDARRDARYAVPDFLRPQLRPSIALLAPDTVPPDSAWLALFNDAGAGPFRFTRRPAAPDAMPHIATGEELGPLPPPDSAWLELFAAADEGPFRFTRPARPAEAPDTPDAGAPPATELADPPGAAPGIGAPPAVEPEQPAAEPEPAPRPPARPRPLGTPVRPPGGGAP
jgi:hypothetical protein